jgi:transcriptional regulator with XRE-family HTH domain
MKEYLVREVAEAQGISLRMLAALTDLSETTLKKFWDNKEVNPTMETLKVIARELKVPVEDLLGPALKNSALLTGSSR